MTNSAQDISPPSTDKVVEKSRPVEKGRRAWQQLKEPIVRGAFIVVEGLDRAGKTTQVKNLADALYATGRNVMTMGFPDRSTDPIGSTIQRYLKEEIQMNDLSIHLLFSANRWEKAKDIIDAVSSGYTVICDRYYYSGLVYGAAKDIPSLSMEWGRGPEVGLPRPDQVIFLNISPEQAAKRGGFGEERYEQEEFQKRIRKLFLQFPKLYTADEGKDFCVIDAGRSEQDVAKDVFKQVEEVVHHVETGKDYPLKHPNTGVQSFGKEIRKVNAWTEDWDTMQSLS